MVTVTTVTVLFSGRQPRKPEGGRGDQQACRQEGWRGLRGRGHFKSPGGTGALERRKTPSPKLAPIPLHPQVPEGAGPPRVSTMQG